MWSMARYSLGVKQSCTSKPSTSSSVDVGAVERVEHRTAHVRQHVRVVGGAVELLLQAQPDGAVAPAVDPPDRPHAGVVAQVVVGDEDDAGAAVGHLAAVEAAQPAFDDGVDVVVESPSRPRRSGTVQPRVCALGLRSGVGEVQLGDRAQVGLVEAVPPVVLVGDAGEHVRPHELGVGALVPDPGRRAEVLRRRCRRARSSPARRRPPARSGTRRTADRRSRPGSRRCPTRTRPRGATTGCPTARRARWRASRRGGPDAANSSPKALATCTTPIVGGVHARGGERGVDHFGGQVGEIEALAGQVAAKSL